MLIAFIVVLTWLMITSSFHSGIFNPRWIYNSRLYDHSKVALTRELGANSKLQNLLSGYDDIECIEIPCIEFVYMPDLERLSSSMNSHDVIVLTSPKVTLIIFI